MKNIKTLILRSSFLSSADALAFSMTEAGTSMHAKKNGNGRKRAGK